MVNSKMNVKIDVFAALFEFVVTLQKMFESSEKKYKKKQRNEEEVEPSETKNHISMSISL